ncbi:Formyl-CoA transferase [Rhizobium sp. CF080]|uniref:CaiB/BaiF CoA transferase family protein n=1 Tax=Rhizobium sp. (strain CF080) TaxID=1144310 RepID=UPI00027192C8|nr:CoA transferase [Rhizobium sp. CF080]EUB99851.1 Formyl-CoA transferase [Rhizobium sp. CF080]
MRPLDGIRILDMTSVLMGPYATAILSDMGAEVIKIEPVGGDILRHAGASRGGSMGGMFMHSNIGKRSVVLDLKTEGGLDALLRIAQTCDVLFYNIRPKAMERLGLGYDKVAAINPGLLYVGAFGFGQNGPYADRAAYDDLIQAASGIPMLIAQASGEAPAYVPVNMADRIVGLHAAIAIVAGLRHRDLTGGGQRIDMPMFETMVSFVLGDHMGGLSFQPSLDQGGYRRLLSRGRKPFATADGYLGAVIYTDQHWQRFRALVGDPVKLADSRYRTFAGRQENIDEVNQCLTEIFVTKTTAQWEELLNAADIPCMPLHSLTSIMDDPHLKAVGFFEDGQHPVEGRIRTMRVPSTWSVSQPEHSGPAPVLGQDTEHVLRELGYSEEEILGLVKEGAVRIVAPETA